MYETTKKNVIKTSEKSFKHENNRMFNNNFKTFKKQKPINNGNFFFCFLTDENLD